MKPLILILLALLTGCYHPDSAGTMSLRSVISILALPFVFMLGYWLYSRITDKGSE